MSTLAQEFNAKWRPLVTPVAQKYGIVPDFLLTQLAQESWWGTQTPEGSNNYAGITDFRKKSDGVMASDAGRQRKFRKFDSEQAFVEHYVNMLTRLYPKVVGAKSIDEFTAALQDGRRKYAESTQYKQHLAEIYNQHYGAGGTTQGDVGTQTAQSSTSTQGATATNPFNTTATSFGIGSLPVAKTDNSQYKDPYDDLWGVKKPKEDNDTQPVRLTTGHQSPYKRGNYKFDWGLR